MIGTSSIRRRAQLLRAFPGVTVDDLRGNVDTRLRKVARRRRSTPPCSRWPGSCAARGHPAALRTARLGRDGARAGTGRARAPGARRRSADAHGAGAARPLRSRSALEAERSLMWRLGGSCALPLGAIADRGRRPHRDARGRISPDGSRVARSRSSPTRPEGAAALATKELIAERRGGDPRGPRTGTTGEAARRPDRPGDAARPTSPSSSSAVRRAGRARRSWPPPSRSYRPDPPRSPGVARPGGRRVRVDHAHQPRDGRRCWRRVWPPRRTSVRSVAAIGEGTAPRSARGPGDARPHAGDVHDRRAGARVPARRGARALRARRHRAAGSGGCARRERMVARRASTPTARGWRGRCPPDARRALRDGDVDAITFTSASTVRGFVGAMGVVRGNPKVVASGPSPRRRHARTASASRRWRARTRSTAWSRRSSGSSARRR